MDVEHDPEFQELVAQALLDLDSSFQKPGPTQPRFGGYHRAAAVLAAFDSEALVPLRTDVEEDLDDLLSNSTVLREVSAGRTQWTLQPNVRGDVLAEMGTREALQQALEANPRRPDVPLQRTLEAYIRGDAPALDGQDLEQLAVTFQVADWLRPVLPDIPDRDTINARMERASLLRPFEDLADQKFRGRRRELEQLRNYVEVLPPESAVDRVVSWFTRGVKEILDLHKRPPLLIYGPGGMGKSTLLSKFILDHVRLDDARRFPFVYLDFDRPELRAFNSVDLRADEPLTLLAEAVRQLGIQYPAARKACQSIRANWQQQMADAVKAGAIVSSQGTARQGRRLNRQAALSDFTSLLATLDIAGKPLLFVLDTFEEVQYSSRAYVQEIWQFLIELQERVPRLRVVAAGRSTIPEFVTENIELTELDQEAARGYLEGHGVTDAALAASLARQIGGNPLYLRLAVEVFKKEGVTSEFFRQLRGSAIQRQLFRRVLEHIHDEDVRKLMHPGLVLRRITPPVIREVLAGPCGVKVDTNERAQTLFEELSRESALVIPDEGGAVRLRPELRRAMLRLLWQDDAAKVIELHRAAVEFYARGPATPLLRAEEIYHRLSLKQVAADVDPRWIAGVEGYLVAAVPELEPPQQAYLASRVGLELTPEVRQAAAIQDWARDAENRVRELSALGRIDEALAVLHERQERRPGSMLDVIEADLLVQKGKLDEAIAVLDPAIDAASHVADPALLTSLLTLSARTRLRKGDYDAARKALDEVEPLVGPESTMSLELALLRATLDRRAGLDSPEAIASAAKLNTMLAAMPDAVLVTREDLLRGAVAINGPHSPDLTLRALKLLNLANLTASERRALARALAAWDVELKARGSLPAEPMAAALKLPEGPERWTSFVESQEPKDLASMLARLLAAYAPTPLFLSQLSVIVSHDAPEAEPGGDAAGSVPLNKESAYQQVRLRLSGAQTKALHGALLAAFPTRSSLEMMVRFRLDRSLGSLSLHDDLSSTLLDLIKAADREGWSAQLVAAARESNPGNPQLVAFAQQVGLAPGPREPVRERVESSPFTDLNEWRTRLGELEPRVCRVEISGPRGLSFATGFLVGPSALLTAYHVIEPFLKGAERPGLKCRFDYKAIEGATLNPGTIFGLAARDWMIDSSPYSKADVDRNLPNLPEPDELDYALLRLDGVPGLEPVGGERAEPGASRRGWIDLARTPEDVSPGSALFILQHPQGGPLKMAIDTDAVIGYNGNRTRLRYRTSTEPGSTGSPCFNNGWQLVAMHHAASWQAGRGEKGFNEGIPAAAIRALLEQRGAGGALEAPPA